MRIEDTQERVNAPTPNGGTYSILYYQDKDGDPITKDKAVQGELIEYDKEGRQVWRTYVSL